MDAAGAGAARSLVTAALEHGPGPLTAASSASHQVYVGADATAAVPVPADCHWGNWLMRGRAVTALLDFEWARFGEPADDWHLLIRFSGPSHLGPAGRARPPRRCGRGGRRPAGRPSRAGHRAPLVA